VGGCPGGEGRVRAPPFPQLALARSMGGTTLGGLGAPVGPGGAGVGGGGFGMEGNADGAADTGERGTKVPILNHRTGP